jgi:hypothetical protein
MNYPVLLIGIPLEIYCQWGNVDNFSACKIPINLFVRLERLLYLHSLLGV